MSREMKHSGIEWIGDVPRHWEVLPHKYVMYKRKNICDNYNGEDILSLTMNGVIIRDLENPSGKMPTTFDGYQSVNKGNLLLCLFDIDVTPRCVGLIENDGLTSPAYSQFVIRGSNVAKYFYYLFRTIDDKKCFIHLSKNLRSSLTETDFGSIKTIVPSPQEQQQIANYLDEKVTEIDNIIAQTTSTIEEYKKYKQSLIREAVTKGLNKDIEMKDSGVEWIGDIPKKWEIRKFKNISILGSGGTPNTSNREFYENGEINWVCSLDLNENEIIDTQEKINELGFQNCAGNMRPINTIAIAMYGGAGTIGNSGILRVEATCNQAICCLTFDQQICDPQYMFYYIKAIRKYWMIYAVGTRKDPNISQTIVANMYAILPSLFEQKQIANYLDKKCTEIDELVTQKEVLLQELESYKKSLIYEVVTGKREVG